jgi:ribonucleoside-triphosphate reductase
MKVIKRDGRVVEFNVQKILNAMKKAFIEIDGYFDETSEKICENIAQSITNLDKPQMNVEEIQDLIEKQLMQSSRKDVAKAYIIYRNDRTRARQQKSELLKEVEEKLFAKNVKNQNANVDEHSFGGRMGAALSVTMKDDALNNRMSKMSYINHVNNMIYVHDLDHYSVGDHNCLSIPFDKLLANGFNTRQTDVRPAQSVGTAFQLVAVIFQLQSLQQFGGVSATHLDWTMVPYVKKSFLKHYIAAWLKDRPEFAELDLVKMVFDDYKEIVDGNIVWRNRFDDWVDSHKDEFFAATNTTEEDYHLGNTDLDKKYAQSALYDTIVETKQAVEGMYHNLNTLQSRSGNQLPFTSINYGTCTSPEGRLIIRCLLETSIKGIGKLHKTSIFPCGIFQLMRGVNRKEGDPNYDLFQLAIRSTSLRLYPNYANVDWSGNKGYDRNDPKTYFSTMGKRKLQLI